MMRPSEIGLVYAAVACIYGAYVWGFRRGRAADRAPGAPAVARRRPGLRGVAWSLFIPGAFLLMYFSLAVHLRLALGRWPLTIGDNPDSWWLRTHTEATWQFLGAMAWSLLIVPAGLIVCLIIRRWTYFAAYLICYAAAALLCLALMHAAPGSFLNWFMD